MASSLETTGVINARNGQFGRTRIATLSSDITTANNGNIWNTTDGYPERPYRLVLDAGGANRTIELAAIGTGADNARPNHSVLISNNGSSNTITVNHSGVAAAAGHAALNPGETVLFVAQTAATTWTAVDFYVRHASTHQAGGDDEINAQLLDFNSDAAYTASNYTPTTTGTSATNTTDLGAHLKGIDNALAAFGNNLAWKNPVRTHTTALLPACTLTSGTNVLLADANGALPTINGVTLAVSDRVLLNQDAFDGDGASGGGSGNVTITGVTADGGDAAVGIYVVDDLGSAGTPWQMTRASDFDTSAEVVAGSAVVIEEGTVNADSICILATNNPITVNVTEQTWVKFRNIDAAQTLTIDTASGLGASPQATYNPYDTAVTISLDAELNDLNDVTIAGVADRHFLIYDGAVDNRWENRLAVISDMSDVDTSGVAADQALRYNSGTTTWVPQTVRTFDVTSANGNIVVGFTGDDPYNPFGAANSVAQLTWSAALADLSNVSSDTLTAYNILTVNAGGTAWVSGTPLTLTAGTGLTIGSGESPYRPFGPGGNATISLNAALNDLSDVTVSSPSDNQILVYNNGTSQWENETPGTLSATASRGVVFTGTYSPTTGNQTIGVSLTSVYDGSTTTLGTTGTMLLNSTTGAFVILDASTTLGGNLMQITNNAGTTNYFVVDVDGSVLGKGGVASGTGSTAIAYSASNTQTVSAANTMLLGGTDVAADTTFSTANTGDNRLVKLFSGGEILIRDASTSGPNYEDGNKVSFLLGDNVETTGAVSATSIGTFDIPDNTSIGFDVIVTGTTTTAANDVAANDIWRYRVGFVASNNATTVSVGSKVVESVEPDNVNFGFDVVTITGGAGDTVTISVATDGSSANVATAVIRWGAHVTGTIMSTA